jgi:excisionase family DNA binding protein
MEKYYTTKQIAEFLSLHVDVVRKKIRQKEIHAINVSKSGKRPEYRISEQSLELYLKQSEN